MINELCVNMRSNSAGALQPVSFNASSPSEVTFTGQRSPPGEPEVNKPPLNHSPDNKTVAVDLFIKKGERFGSSSEKRQKRGVKMLQAGGFFVNSGSHSENVTL